MLVLTRKVNERILVGDGIWITLVRVRGTQSVQIGIEAPGLEIRREECAFRDGHPGARPPRRVAASA